MYSNIDSSDSSGISMSSSPAKTPDGMSDTSANDLDVQMSNLKIEACHNNCPMASSACAKVAARMTRSNGSASTSSLTSATPSPPVAPATLPEKSPKHGLNPNAPAFFPRSIINNIPPHLLQSLSDTEKGIFHSARISEQNQHAFSRYYNTPRQPIYSDAAEEPARKMLLEYTHGDALDFIAMTHVWKLRDRPTQELHTPPVCKESVNQFPTAKGVKAVYRVIRDDKHREKYILLACHMNVHGLHRGDLRFVEVNNRSKAHGWNYTTIGYLCIGDIIAVTELARTDVEELSHDVNEVDDKTPAYWMAAKMTVMTRVEFQHVPLTFLLNRAAVVKNFSEVMYAQFSTYLPEDAQRNMYIGSGFVPVKVRNDFSNGFNNWNGLHVITAKIRKYPNSMGVVTKYTMSEELTAFFECGWDAFAQDELDSVAVAELCAIMGSNAVNAVQKGRFDGRSFRMHRATKDKNVIRFSIRNPADQPTMGLWRPRTRLTVGGHGTNATAVIETVIENGHFLDIVARLSRKHLGFTFSEKVHMVAQAEAPETKGLEENFLQDLPKESNGRKVIEILYGREPEIPNFPPCPRARFPCKTEYEHQFGILLNDYQSQYVDRVTRRTPLTIANAPFGCGKSVTIVTAAMASVGQAVFYGQRGCELLVTQSNFAAINLVDILKKTGINWGNFDVLRMVSEVNWNELPDDCRTELDFPSQLLRLCQLCVTGDISCPYDNILVQFLIFLMDRQALPCRFNPRAYFYLHNLHAYRREKFDFLIASYFTLIQPQIIVVTADSLPMLVPVLQNRVRSIQFDEASQLPEWTLLKIVSTFPHAWFGLVGDIHQLPPYKDRDLTGCLDQFGIGNTMERSVQNKLFPEAVLEVVYRCHPLTTQLLGRMFYGSALTSGVRAQDREITMVMRPDIWPNTSFPILVFDNSGGSKRMGTSVGNPKEMEMVIQLINKLVYKSYPYHPVEAPSIGIISFYKAQATLLTEKFRYSNIKCGTVDSFQGSERDIMILCTTNDMVTDFMRCPKRINVAFSRAKHSTIVIGNLDVLTYATYWKTIIEEATKHNSVEDYESFLRRVTV